jgi:histidine triad (HIT) family protein
MTTIFDKILKGDLPSDKVYEDDHVFAFRDISPVAQTHVLVVPKEKTVHFSELKDCSVEYVGEFFKRVSKVACELGLEEQGFRIVLNNGRHGCQTVDYLHAHIIGGQQLSGAMA